MKPKNGLLVALVSLLIFTLLAACSGASATSTPDPNAAQPSNTGGPGKALTLTGDVKNGEKVFADKCAECHGDQGKGGIANEGSDDGTIPELNPIDETIVNKDPKVFAANLDVFIEHGSTPEGSSPTRVMLPFGDTQILQPQEIADVIAYVISLNKQ
jgi:mono/diheme cytochrome c family protein